LEVKQKGVSSDSPMRVFRANEATKIFPEKSQDLQLKVRGMESHCEVDILLRTSQPPSDGKYGWLMGTDELVSQVVEGLYWYNHPI